MAPTKIPLFLAISLYMAQVNLPDEVILFLNEVEKTFEVFLSLPYE